jgi:hypothetical protein
VDVTTLVFGLSGANHREFEGSLCSSQARYPDYAYAPTVRRLSKASTQC